MANDREYVKLAFRCANICQALGRGVNGKKLGELGDSVCEAINQLTM